MDTENLISVFISKDFYKTINVHTSTSPTKSTHRELSCLILHPFFLQLLFSLSNCCNFWPSVYYTWDKIVIYMRFLTSQSFSYKYTFFFCLMCKHGALNNVTNCINI